MKPGRADPRRVTCQRTQFLRDEATPIRFSGAARRVSDLADAHVCALDWLAKGNPSQSFNLGNGRGFSVAEVVTETCPRRPGDPRMLVSDSGRARELLRWIPKHPNLDQQIAHAGACASGFALRSRKNPAVAGFW